jgi:hypothetical protein
MAADTLDREGVPMTHRYKVIAESNGHKWMDWHGMICCRDCGLLRRPNDDNEPCKGVTKIALRSHSQP